MLDEAKKDKDFYYAYSVESTAMINMMSTTIPKMVQNAERVHGYFNTVCASVNRLDSVGRYFLDGWDGPIFNKPQHKLEILNMMT